jgi:hypothetical protein
VSYRARAILAALVALGGGLALATYCLHGPTRERVVVTSVLVPASPSETWAAIASFAHAGGAIPWSMTLGLPRPVRCTLEAPRVGARRTCYFDDGRIEQEVRRWEPPTHMAFTITRTLVRGADYVDYPDATYDLAPEGTSTRVVRTTRVSSRLRPAAWFDPLVQRAVETEHEYLLASVAKSAHAAEDR